MIMSSGYPRMILALLLAGLVVAQRTFDVDTPPTATVCCPVTLSWSTAAIQPVNLVRANIFIEYLCQLKNFDAVILQSVRGTGYEGDVLDVNGIYDTSYSWVPQPGTTNLNGYRVDVVDSGQWDEEDTGYGESTGTFQIVPNTDLPSGATDCTFPSSTSSVVPSSTTSSSTWVSTTSTLISTTSTLISTTSTPTSTMSSSSPTSSMVTSSTTSAQSPSSSLSTPISSNITSSTQPPSSSISTPTSFIITSSTQLPSSSLSTPIYSSSSQSHSSSIPSTRSSTRSSTTRQPQTSSSRSSTRPTSTITVAPPSASSSTLPPPPNISSTVVLLPSLTGSTDPSPPTPPDVISPPASSNTGGLPALAPGQPNIPPPSLIPVSEDSSQNLGPPAASSIFIPDPSSFTSSAASFTSSSTSSASSSISTYVPSYPGAPPSGFINVSITVDDPRITYYGNGWKDVNVFAMIGSSCNASSPSARDNMVADTFTFSFTGIAVYMAAATTDHSGGYTVSIDGQAPVQLDGYSANPTPNCGYAWSSFDMDNTAHSVTVNLTGQSARASTSNVTASSFELDGFTITQAASSTSSSSSGRTPSCSVFIAAAIVLISSLLT